MAYTAKVKSITNDGTNLFVSVEISDGSTTFPTITPVFPSDKTIASIKTYIQTLANNAPTLTLDQKELVGYTATQA